MMRSHSRQTHRSERFHGGVDRRRVRLMYGRQWAAYSRQFRADHPLCVRCGDAGVVTASQVVDHIQSHRGNQNLFWDPNNHQALCKKCHDAKTAREDGGGGRNLPKPE